MLTDQGYGNRPSGQGQMLAPEMAGSGALSGTADRGQAHDEPFPVLEILLAFSGS